MSEKRFQIFKVGEYEEEYFVDTEQEIIDEEDYFEVKSFATMSNEQVVVLLNELYEENEMLKKRLSLYDEDEVDKYLRTHPMPTTTITNKRKVIPLNMRHRRY